MAAADLPQAGQSGFNGAVGLKMYTIAFDFRRYDWTGSDDAHLTEEHVDQLGQFVEAIPPQECSKRRYPRVLPKLLERLPFGSRFGGILENLPDTTIRPVHHCSEFEAIERLS